MSAARSFLSDLIWAIFTTVFFTYKIGYLFGTIDGEELLPVVYRLLDSNLYPGDPFVEAAVNVQPIRAGFIYTLAGLGKLMPVSAAALLLQAFCLVVIAMLLMRIARQLFPTAAWAAPLAPVLAMVYFSTWTLGGNAYIDNMLLPHSFAATAGTAGAYLFLKKRYLACGAVLGLAALFQPLLAGQLFGMLCIVLMFSKESSKWRSLFSMGCAFVLAVSPLIIAHLLYDSPEASPAQKALFAERYFVYQHGLHYLPSGYPLIDWLHFGGLVAVGLFLLFRFRHPGRRGIAFFAGSGLAAMLLYSILVEGAGWLSVCAVQAFKASVWIAAVMSVVIAGYVGKGLSLLLPIGPRHASVLLFAMAGTLYFGLVITHVRGFENQGLGGDWYRIGHYPESDLTRLHRWLRDSTARDAVVLSSPLDGSLLCEAQRSTPASYKAFLHQPVPFLEWFDRYHRVYGLSYQPGSREMAGQSVQHATVYDSLTSAHFDSVCHYDYRIVRLGFKPDSAMKVLRREGNWLLLAR